MLRPIRQRLRLIRYYSAPRRRTLLTIFVDIALVAAIVLALPTSYLVNTLVRRDVASIELDGHLTRLPDDGVQARILNPNLNQSPRSDVPYGEFHLSLTRTRSGWPASAAISDSRVRVDLNLYDQPNAQKDARLATDDPVYLAITDALEHSGAGTTIIVEAEDEASLRSSEEDYAELKARWRANEAANRHRPLAWIFNTLAMWALLSILLSALASSLWAVTLIFKNSRTGLAHQRRKEGLCVKCGYDLFGLDFNERCPECGTIIE